MSDRAKIRATAESNGWSVPDDYGWQLWAQFHRGARETVEVWFSAQDPETLNCSDSRDWKRESYGPAALKRVLRTLRAKP